jgi:hypothetical protein
VFLLSYGGSVGNLLFGIPFTLFFICTWLPMPGGAAETLTRVQAVVPEIVELKSVAQYLKKVAIWSVGTMRGFHNDLRTLANDFAPHLVPRLSTLAPISLGPAPVQLNWFTEWPYGLEKLPVCGLSAFRRFEGGLAPSDPTDKDSIAEAVVLNKKVVDYIVWKCTLSDEKSIKTAALTVSRRMFGTELKEWICVSGNPTKHKKKKSFAHYDPDERVVNVMKGGCI